MNGHSIVTDVTRRLTLVVAAIAAAFAVVAALPTQAAAVSTSALGSGASGDGRVYPNHSCRELGYTNPTPYALGNGGGYVEIFYSRSKDANCAQTINTTGDRRYTAVRLARTDTDPSDSARDDGHYISYAGAVVLRNAGGDCINFYGEVDYRGGSWINKTGVHCG